MLNKKNPNLIWVTIIKYDGQLPVHHSYIYIYALLSGHLILIIINVCAQISTVVDAFV